MDKTDHHGELGEEVPHICFPPLLSFPLWELGFGDVSTYRSVSQTQNSMGAVGSGFRGQRKPEDVCAQVSLPADHPSNGTAEAF